VEEGLGRIEGEQEDLHGISRWNRDGVEGNEKRPAVTPLWNPTSGDPPWFARASAPRCGHHANRMPETGFLFGRVCTKIVILRIQA
jgi:hypothetical protein